MSRSTWNCPECQSAVMVSRSKCMCGTRRPDWVEVPESSRGYEDARDPEYCCIYPGCHYSWIIKYEGRKYCRWHYYKRDTPDYHRIPSREELKAMTNPHRTLPDAITDRIRQGMSMDEAREEALKEYGAYMRNT